MNLQRAYQALLNAYETLQWEGRESSDGEFHDTKCAEIMPGLLDLAEAAGAAWPKRCERCDNATSRERVLPSWRRAVDCVTCEDIAESLVSFFRGSWNTEHTAQLRAAADAVRATPCDHGKFTHAGEHCDDCSASVQALIRGMFSRVVL